MWRISRYVILMSLPVGGAIHAQGPLTDRNAGASPPRKVRCNTEFVGIVCRAENASLVWCRKGDALAQLEAAVSGEPARRDALIEEAAQKGLCGTSAGIVMHAPGGPPVPEKTIEGDVDHPAVSKILFAAAKAGATPPVCQEKGFCAVRPNVTAWACPKAEDLRRSERDKVQAGCLQLNPGDTGAFYLENPSEGLISLDFGTNAIYWLSRDDLLPVTVDPPPRNRYKGWCKVGDWCETVAPILFCADRPALDRVLAVPPGEGRRTAITAEKSCQILARGNPLKPLGESHDKERVSVVVHPVHG